MISIFELCVDIFHLIDLQIIRNDEAIQYIYL